MSKKKNKQQEMEREQERLKEIDWFESRCHDVTREEFERYKEVREEGKIPLYEISNFMKATDLSSDRLFKILNNYHYLVKKFKDPVINKKKKQGD